MKVKTQALTMSSGETVTFRQLPVLEVADYVERYGERLHASGAFDTFSFRGGGMTLRDADFSTFGVVGQALVQLITARDENGAKQGTGSLVGVFLDHCKLFGVVLSVDGQDVKLDSADAVNEYIEDMGFLVELTGRLAMTVFVPLFTRLTSLGAERRKKSATSSPESLPES